MPTASRAPTSVAAHIEPLRDGVLVVGLTGLLTSASLMSVKASILSMGLTDIRAFVADYTKAVIAFDGDGLDAALMDEPTGAVATKPAALLVLPGDAPLFIGHAVRMATRGHFRRCFADPAEALSWARCMALRPPAY